MDYAKFNASVDIDGLKAEIEKAGQSTGEYGEVPVNHDYDVEVEKLELTESKKGDPMVTCWFRIIDGDYTGQMLFMNQVVTQGFQIHIVNTLLRSLRSGLEIGFENFEQYGTLIEDVFDNISEKYEYTLRYGSRKGFPTFTIKDAYELEN